MGNAEFFEDVHNRIIDENAESEKHTVFVNIYNLLKSRKPLEDIAEKILNSTLLGMDIENKDTLDRFIDFVYFKVKTGAPYIPSLAYPTQRMADSELEDVIIKLINVYLMPEIIFRVLKFFARNVQNSDTNLYLAHLLRSEEIIKSVYDTFVLFRNDVKINDRVQRSMNVKRIQQYSSHSDPKASSPVDAACRFKYILEYIALNVNVNSIYTKEDLKLSNFS